MARDGEVELRSLKTREIVRALPGHPGAVNAVAFSKDGRQLFAASGVPSGKGLSRSPL